MATRWLFKTEPSVYSYQQLVKDKETMWDGVGNNLALKHLKDIKKGEQIFIYHTGDEKAAVGVRGRARERSRRVARVLERFPGDLQQKTLLRIHAQGFAA